MEKEQYKVIKLTKAMLKEQFSKLVTGVDYQSEDVRDVLALLQQGELSIESIVSENGIPAHGRDRGGLRDWIAKNSNLTHEQINDLLVIYYRIHYYEFFKTFQHTTFKVSKLIPLKKEIKAVSFMQLFPTPTKLLKYYFRDPDTMVAIFESLKQNPEISMWELERQTSTFFELTNDDFGYWVLCANLRKNVKKGLLCERNCSEIEYEFL
ncbi:hypothetical protein [Streptococcus dentiloxodontae]